MPRRCCPSGIPTIRLASGIRTQLSALLTGVWRSCLECGRPLDSVTCSDSPDGEIFCRLCYGKNFGPHGYRHGGAGSDHALVTTLAVRVRLMQRTDFVVTYHV